MTDQVSLLRCVITRPDEPGRLIVRGTASADAAGRAFGVTLPRQACRANAAGNRAALWLGPDEWLLMSPDAERAEVWRSLATALAGQPHGLVDVSDRQVAFLMSGPDAAAVLNSACPMDLDGFATASCTRTIFGKAEIVLWRRSAHEFWIDVARSFAAYAATMLDEARRG